MKIHYLIKDPLASHLPQFHTDPKTACGFNKNKLDGSDKRFSIDPRKVTCKNCKAIINNKIAKLVPLQQTIVDIRHEIKTEGVNQSTDTSAKEAFFGLFK